jgi:hypothetical protein
MKRISESMALKIAYGHGANKEVENLIYKEGYTPYEALEMVGIYLTEAECDELIENTLLDI